MSDAVQRFLQSLRSVRPSGQGWVALCPAHDDRNASLSVGEGDDGRVLLKCHAGCSAQEIVSAMGLQMRDLFERPLPPPPPSPQSPAAEPVGLTLDAYARAKRLPIPFLRELGLSQISYQGNTALRIPFADEEGSEIAVRFRLALRGDNRFRWRKGSKVMPYGLPRLKMARQLGYTILVEGSSDAQTLWYHSLPALGLPGATTWRPEWATLLEGLRVYVWREPDRGGDALLARLGKSMPEALVLVPPDGVKDISEYHVAGNDVSGLVHQLIRQARPLAELRAREVRSARAEALARAGQLPQAADILSDFAVLTQRLGLAGERRNAQLLYLALTSRVLDRPVSLVVKGPSSGGKSFLVETVLRAFPDEACYVLSAMSEHALAYSEEPLAHRFLVIYEAAGLGGDFAAYLLRSLLSEGRVRYETVEKTQDGLRPRLIEREGPTGLLVTTTRAGLHPENETRMFSITVQDDPQQTRAVLRIEAAAGNGHEPEPPDLTPWQALQEWLAAGDCRVTIPFAPWLAEQTDSHAVRLRRDFGAVLRLIRAHAILHQANRVRDERGWIVASAADYAAVYDLVAELVSEGVRARARQTMRDTVEVVRRLTAEKGAPATRGEVARALDLDPSAAGRRLYAAAHDGYLVNEGKGSLARWRLGEPLPGERTVLPAPEALVAWAAQEGEGEASRTEAIAHLHTASEPGPVCRVCSDNGGVGTPLPLDGGTGDHHTELEWTMVQDLLDSDLQ